MSRNEIAAPRIVWHLTNDGMKPTRAPNWFVARNPVIRTVRPKESIRIDLCVASSCPLLAFPVGTHRGDVTPPEGVIPAGQEVIITVTNHSTHADLILESGEGLLNLVPLLLPANLEAVFE